MPTSEVIAGAFYRHDNTFRIMRLEVASVPQCNDNVELIDPDSYCRNGFIDKAWRGTWSEFKEQWTQVEDEHGQRRTS